MSGWFTLTELTDHLKVTRATARTWTVNSGCPHVPLGAETFFLADSFRAWLKSHELSHATCELASVGELVANGQEQFTAA